MHAERLDITNLGLGVTQTVFTVDSRLAFVGGAFSACKDALADVKATKGKAGDVGEAGRRVVDVLMFLEALPGVAEQENLKIEDEVAPLENMIKGLGACVQVFGKKGWLRKAWEMKSYLKKLAKLDKQIKRLIDRTNEMVSLARDETVLRLEIRTFPLECEIRKRVRERQDETGDEEDEARAELAADPAVMAATAAEAGVPEAVYLEEIGDA